MSEKQFRLSRKRKKWAKQFKPSAAIRGNALNYPVSIQIRFTREVQRLVNRVMKKTETEVLRAFKTPEAKEFFAEDAGIAEAANKGLDKFFASIEEMVEKRARAISEEMVAGANKASAASMAGSLKELSGGVTLKPSNLGGDIPDKLLAAIEVNVDLIVSINQAYLGKVSDAVNRSIMLGQGLEDLIPFFAEQKGITKRHAKNVALDQTRKAFTSLNVARMENVGLSKYEWVHSGGGQKPRKFHIDRFPDGLNGGIYDINDPPIADPKTGERGHPSWLPNCKCRMRPVLVLDNGETQ